MSKTGLAALAGNPAIATYLVQLQANDGVDATQVDVIPTGMEAVYENIHYAPAVRVGNTLFISGQIGRDENMELVEDKESQFVQTFENMKKVLDAAGARFEDIVDVTSFHTDMRDLPLYMKVRDRYFTKNYPAWTAIGAASLCGAPGYFLEVKATAVIPGA